MDSQSNVVKNAVTSVESHQLRHPYGSLLVEFIRQAVDPKAAATFISSQIRKGVPAARLAHRWQDVVEAFTIQAKTPSAPDPDTEALIRERDGDKCCLSGKKGSFLDPLVIVPLVKIPTGWVTTRQPLVAEMLEVFFGIPFKAWWFDFIKNADQLTALHTHWLVRRSVAQAFEQGFIRLDMTDTPEFPHILSPVIVGPEQVKIKFDSHQLMLDDQSASGIITVHRRFITTHARMTKCIRLLDIASAFDPNRPLVDRDNQPPLDPEEYETIRPMTWGVLEKMFGFNPIKSTALAFWRLLPQKARAAAYKALRKLGASLYGDVDATVQKLPLGFYLKVHSNEAHCRNEYTALTMLHRRTSIPGPKPCDVVYGSEGEDSYLLMSNLRGMPLSRCIDAISDNDLDDISISLAVFVYQLRCIPNPNAPDALICDAAGGPCNDTRLVGNQNTGPFQSESEFSQVLGNPNSRARRGHEIVFTHGDLDGPRILVDLVDGKWIVTGVVDWDSAGFYPVYWEFTKAIFKSCQQSGRYNYFVHSIFTRLGDYSNELVQEMRCWNQDDHRRMPAAIPSDATTVE